MGVRQLKRIPHSNDTYQKFDDLNGKHPWMEACPEGFVSYRVRELRSGDIGYFNFALAKEMGLIPENHPNHMTAHLKEKLLKVFSIQIINEYDEIKKTPFDPETIKPNKYMASRYLQLQHSNKQGKTSGDGRGIWNGVVEHKGKTWDVSSRGTGVTKLAPGSVEANKPLKTGVGEFGYGCGLAEIDELYSAAILAEIMHLQGVSTERVLCIVDHGRGYGIGVRASTNLLRPAHLFLYLKQNRLAELRAGVEYFLKRQKHNNRWKIKTNSAHKYDEMMTELTKSFAEFAAQLEVDYVFAWLDWDGDNVLMDAGIIDYGSVRQFGSRHDKYRYDDVERFSTSLNEQKNKARLIVQVIAQMVDYLKTGQRKPMKEFNRHTSLAIFDQAFEQARGSRLLYRMGFDQGQRNRILKNKVLFNMFYKEFTYFEKAKISGDAKKVSDGINHPPLFNMRNILRVMPEKFSKQGIEAHINEEEMFQSMLSTFSKQRDTQLRTKHKAHIQNFTRLYRLLVATAMSKESSKKVLSEISDRSKILNREDRITGNALIQIVNEMIGQIKKGMPLSDVQKLIDQLIFMHLGIPEVEQGPFYTRRPRAVAQPQVFEKFMKLIADYRDDI